MHALGLATLGKRLADLTTTIAHMQAFFYVTEGSTSRHNLLYYRKQDWYAVWSRGMASLTTSVLRRVTKVRSSGPGGT